MPKRARDPPLRGSVYVAWREWQARKKAALDDLPLCARRLLAERKWFIDEGLKSLDEWGKLDLEYLGAKAKKHASPKKCKTSSSSSQTETEPTVFDRVASLFKHI